MLPIGIPAASAANCDKTVTYKVSEEAMEQEFQAKIDEAIREKSAKEMTPYGNYDYTYTTEVADTRTTVVSGYPGNQPPGGTRFRKPGFFYWKDSGGPEVNASVTFSVPLKVVEFSVALGIEVGDSSEVGRGLFIEDTTHFWKLYIYKNMEVRHTKIWQTNRHTGEVKLYMETYVPVLASYELDAKQV